METEEKLTQYQNAVLDRLYHAGKHIKYFNKNGDFDVRYSQDGIEFTFDLKSRSHKILLKYHSKNIAIFRTRNNRLIKSDLEINLEDVTTVDYDFCGETIYTVDWFCHGLYEWICYGHKKILKRLL